MSFVLHERLAADTYEIGDGKLSRFLLMNDARFPWLILVPRANASELFDLDADARALLTEETAHAGKVLKFWSGADKINTAAIGNIVPQLHMHVVARKKNDEAWPGTVWGKGAAQAYAPQEAARIVAELRAILF